MNIIYSDYWDNLQVLVPVPPLSLFGGPVPTLCCQPPRPQVVCWMLGLEWRRGGISLLWPLLHHLHLVFGFGIWQSASRLWVLLSKWGQLPQDKAESSFSVLLEQNLLRGREAGVGSWNTVVLELPGKLDRQRYCISLLSWGVFRSKNVTSPVWSPCSCQDGVFLFLKCTTVDSCLFGFLWLLNSPQPLIAYLLLCNPQPQTAMLSAHFSVLSNLGCTEQGGGSAFLPGVIMRLCHLVTWLGLV